MSPTSAALSHRIIVDYGDTGTIHRITLPTIRSLEQRGIRLEAEQHAASRLHDAWMDADMLRHRVHIAERSLELFITEVMPHFSA